MNTVFLRVLEAEDKATALLEVVCDPAQARGHRRYDVDPTSFLRVPRSPFAYWVSERLRQVFVDLPRFESEGRTVKQGLASADDFRFVRAWWSVPPSTVGERWFPFAKGGLFAPFYRDVTPVVNWERSGEEIRNNLNDRGGIRSNVWMLKDTSTQFFFRSGLTWPLRGVRFSAQAVPQGCVFSVAGKMAFTPAPNHGWLLALFNALVFDKFIAFFAGKIGGVQYEVGLIQNIPVPRPSDNTVVNLAAHGRRAWSLKRSLDTRTEISHAFTLPTLLQMQGTHAAVRAMAWSERVRAIDTELAGIQAEIDERCFELYGINQADRHAMTEGFGTPESDDAPSGGESDSEEDADDDSEEANSTADATALAAELASWVVGVAFGRFDVRLATGARPMPTEPEPFDPLPVCSPGMLTGVDGLPLAQPPAGYPVAFPETGVLVDDPGHPQDLTAAVRAVFDVVFGADADRWWNDVAALLDPKGHDLRSWLAGSFFEHHLKRYSKSRRKAPILWQLGTPSGRYSVWLYAHRLTRDSLFQLQNEVVGQKLMHEERQLASLRQNAGAGPSASERKEIAAREAFVEELRAMLDDVKLVAPLWNPNLDDGVVLTMAPLGRLVPQHKPWQRELRSKWEELAVGKYDWAHVAMHLWPERVIPKCAADRSVAIAHGLEDVFWVEGVDGKWKPSATPARPVDELVDERSSPAVKAALKSILNVANAASSSASARSRSGR
jgi:hypothetical protein